MGIGMGMQELPGLGRAAKGGHSIPLSEMSPAEIAQALGGAWFNGVHFPEGTQFRATYKGTPYFAEIKNGLWVDSNGVVRTSPSDAASEISDTNVNGWRFWHALKPGDTEWRRLEEFKP